MEWHEYEVKFFDENDKVVDVETIRCISREEAKAVARWLTEKSDKFVEYTKVKRIYKYQKIANMYNRTFRTNTYFQIVSVKDGDVKVTNLFSQKECKDYIYSKCNREEDYEVTEWYKNKNNGNIIIVKSWLYRFKREGPIFTKKIYDRLEEMRLQLKRNELKFTFNTGDYD